MKSFAVFIILLLLVFGPAFGQQATLPKGNVIIVVPLFAEDLIPEAVDQEPYKFRLRDSTGNAIAVPHTGRIARLDPTSGSKSRSDNYEVRVSSGTYTIEIEDVPNFRLPNFYVTSQDRLQFLLPQAHFAWDFVCFENQLVLRTNLDEDPEFSKRNSIRAMKREMLKFGREHSAVIYHCGETREGNTRTYLSGRIYYRNHYFSGQTLELDKSTLSVTAIGGIERPVNYIVAGVEFLNTSRVVFDLRKEELLSASPDR